MQSFLDQRRFYKQLETQIVVKHEQSEDVRTHERRYWYRGEGGLGSEDREPDNGEPARRRREHGHRTIISGPTLEPRHSVREHLEREGDVEQADYAPEVQADPYTINTRDTMGGNVDMMVTGVERERTRQAVNGTTNGTANGTTDGVDGASHGDPEKEKIVLVMYEGDTDEMDPHNWTFTCRVACTTLVSLLASLVLWSSTIDTSALTSTRKLYQTSFELQSVPTAMYLIGLGIGGMVTAPVSELFGRNPRIVCRGLAGLFASAPLVCAAAALVDLWSLIERVYAFPYFAIISFLGPTIGPTLGGFINMSPRISWRWVDWITIIMCGVLVTIVFLFLPETYSTVRLSWKAKQLRRLTGDDRYRAPMEFHRYYLSRCLAIALTRPVILCISEPIILIFSGYMAITFIILYTFSAGYVSIFQNFYGLDQGQTGLAFLGITIGIISAGLVVPFSMMLTRRDIYRARARSRTRPEPEFTLYMAMFGAPMIPVGLFWMGWTTYAALPVWVPMASSLVFGFGILCVFVSAYQYVAATFEYHPGSALASIQMFRLSAAGVMAVVADIMYKKLGVHWSLTVLGGIATFFLPVPYLLYTWGHRVRKWSRYIPNTEQSQ
ncbi:hypothetical protein N7532_010199 [Penicillium argentinense]|uniref:Major facilitator superfamily (MFS) profile domain-containing protein n=1 Tax=Penicillium argentinense TaxID=1131581 RepID=A0A9W9EP55_9EURO|nr:uncharacterized protein N7532_010199 [Penicillium argentinense]KAJ5085428.1 hypothetical protein N7532_010199 [Penicillium argentinense]